MELLQGKTMTIGNLWYKREGDFHSMNLKDTDEILIFNKNLFIMTQELQKYLQVPPESYSLMLNIILTTIWFNTKCQIPAAMDLYRQQVS